MKYCSNCHRLSRDDDFCSHCGSAVYGDNSGSSIDCTDIPGHTHEKQRSESIDCADIPGHSHEKQTFTQQSSAPKKKGNGCFVLFIIIFILMFIAPYCGGLLELITDMLEGM